jgi:hypothetical protein
MSLNLTSPGLTPGSQTAQSFLREKASKSGWGLSQGNFWSSRGIVIMLVYFGVWQGADIVFRWLLGIGGWIWVRGHQILSTAIVMFS